MKELPPALIGYARVSTGGQDLQPQVDALTRYGCQEVFTDKGVSGSRNHLSPKFRDVFSRAKELREEGRAVTVVVTKLDRFARNTKALLEGVEELGAMGVSFYAIKDSFSLDMGNPASKLLLTMLGALAEFEASLIRGRMADGKEAALERGMRFGARPALTSAAVRSIREEFARGTTTDRRLAKEWGVSRSTIARVLGLYGNTTPYVTSDEYDKAKKLANKDR